MTEPQPTYSVVVPVYESSDSVVELVSRLTETLRELGQPFEILLVDDGSQNPETWPTLRWLSENRNEVDAIRLTRNFGKAGAVLAGLSAARGHWIATIDDDLQQSPEDFALLVQQQDHDVVVGVAPRRYQSLTARWGGALKSWFDRRILRLPCAMSPFKLIRSEVARAALEVKTPRPFIPALLAHVTRDFVAVPIEHQPSANGRSRYSLTARLRQTSSLLINNSSLLLRWSGWSGLVVAASGFLYAAVVVTRKLLGYTIQPGWSSLVVLNLCFGGILLVVLSLIGEYLIRILEGTTSKPPFVVREVVRSGADEVPPTRP